MRFIRLIAFALVVGCGSSSTTLPDASPGADAAPDTAVDAPPLEDPVLLEVTPEGTVGPWLELRFYFDRAVDETVFSAITLTTTVPIDCERAPWGEVTMNCAYLRQEVTQSVTTRATLEVDGSEVVVKPVDPLGLGKRYTWQLSSVELADGTHTPTANGTLQVIRNEPTRRTLRDETGAVIGWTDYTYDDDHGLVETIEARAGDDAMLGTDDDLEVRWVHVNDAEGRPLDSRLTVNGNWEAWYLRTYTDDGLERTWLIVDAGADGTFDTDDDTAYGTEWSYDGQGRVIRHVSGLAPLAAWPEGLVIEIPYSSFTYADGSYPIGHCMYGLGDDGLIGTADDQQPGLWQTPLCQELELDGDRPLSFTWTQQGTVVHRRAYLYDAQGRATRVVRFQHPGPDGTWATVDDRIQMYTQWDYEDMAMTVLQYSVLQPGPDGVFLTRDDLLRDGTLHGFDSDGRVVLRIHFNTAGPDGRWQTGDEEVSDIQVWDHDAHGSVTRFTDWSPGEDLQRGTGDDVIEGYMVFEYDGVGARLREARSDNPGPDGEWFTVDDVFVDVTEFETEW